VMLSKPMTPFITPLRCYRSNFLTEAYIYNFTYIQHTTHALSPKG
jgi:hypothetical protein